MAETRESEQDRLMDQTLSLFENAIAETGTTSPTVQFGRAVGPRGVPPAESPAREKPAASLIGQAVSFVRTVAGFAPDTVQTGSPSPRPPVARQAWEKPA